MPNVRDQEAKASIESKKTKRGCDFPFGLRSFDRAQSQAVIGLGRRSCVQAFRVTVTDTMDFTGQQSHPST